MGLKAMVSGKGTLTVEEAERHKPAERRQLARGTEDKKKQPLPVQERGINQAGMFALVCLLACFIYVAVVEAVCWKGEGVVV